MDIKFSVNGDKIFGYRDKVLCICVFMPPIEQIKNGQINWYHIACLNVQKRIGLFVGPSFIQPIRAI